MACVISEYACDSEHVLQIEGDFTITSAQHRVCAQPASSWRHSQRQVLGCRTRGCATLIRLQRAKAYAMRALRSLARYANCIAARHIPLNSRLSHPVGLRGSSLVNVGTRLGYCSDDMTGVIDLFNSTDDDLFFRFKTSPNHVLQPYLPDQKDIPYKVRARSHNINSAREVPNIRNEKPKYSNWTKYAPS